MTTRRRMAEGLDSKQRLLSAAVRLFSEQGYAATGVKEIAARGDAPMGSFYFHFPGGKEALGVAALAQGAERFRQFLEEHLERAESLEDALAGCAERLADLLEASDWMDGCPVATTALESVGRSPALIAASARGFELWRQALGERIERAGIAATPATVLACNVLSLLEGAELQARVDRSRAPLHHAAQALRVLARSAGAGHAGSIPVTRSTS